MRYLLSEKALTPCPLLLYIFPAVPPTITGGEDGPTERKVILSKHLTLECEAAGHPPPSLTWLKDGVPVHHGDSVRLLEQGRKLEILSASISDSGRYICVATSIAGEKEVKYDVKVLGKETQRMVLFWHNHILSIYTYIIIYYSFHYNHHAWSILLVCILELQLHYCK